MLNQLNKNIFVFASIFFLSAGAMEQPAPNQYAAIKFRGDASRASNLAFISFEKAKIKANAAQLLREIPKATRGQNEIYTPEQAIGIINTALANFGGNENSVPVSGFLENLEAMEKHLYGNNCLHGLASYLYELERANDLTASGHVIKGFRTKIELPCAIAKGVKPNNNICAAVDIEICAENKDGHLVLEKLKSFKFAAPKAIKAVRTVIDSLSKIKEARDITCTLHSKFTMPTEIQEYAREKGVALEQDSPVLITPPQDKPVYTARPIPNLIDPHTIKIKVPDTCIVCYEEVSKERAAFTNDLEEAHIDYLVANLDQDTEYYNLRSWRSIYERAKKQFKLMPGFLKTILTSSVMYMEEKKWPDLRSTLFELMSALDIPEEKSVVAFGAEFFYDERHLQDPKNPRKKLDHPVFKITPEGHTIYTNGNVGYDLDVLLTEKNHPNKYSCIEATTGGLACKSHDKFQSIGRALNAEIYVLHNLERNDTNFMRTAYWKRPAAIALPNNTVHQLEWPLISRTQACLEELRIDKNVYNPIELTSSDATLAEYNRMHPAHPIKDTAHVLEDLPATVAAIFKLIDHTCHHADEEVFRRTIKKGLEELLVQEKENNRPGSIAFAILFLNQLNCTIQDSALKERYLAKVHQYSFDLNAVLKNIFDEIVENQN